MNAPGHFIFLTLGLHPDQVGGAFRYVAEVTTRLAARGHRVEVITPNPKNQLAPTENRFGVTIHRFPNGEGFFWTNWRRENASARDLLAACLARAGTARPPLIVVCHAFLTPAAADASAPQVALFTGPWAEEFLFSRQARRRSLPRRCFDQLVADRLRAVERVGLTRARRILTISEYYVAQLPSWHPAPLPAVDMISGGVDAEKFHPAADRPALRARLGLAPETFVFLTVRRLDPRMGLPTLLEAFAGVRAKHPSAQLWIAGTGPQGDELRARSAALGIGDAAHFLGFVPDADLPDRYRAADCTVVPSLALEGFGLVTAESLACGTPVLGSDSGATPELLAPLGRQLLFPPGSGPALATRFAEVLANPALLPNRARCRAHAVQTFSWDRPVAALERAHTDFTGGTR